MYTYGAGSPKTYNGFGAPRLIDVEGPGYGTYLQMDHPLSYAPRFSGVYEAAGSPGGYRGYGSYYAAGSPGGYRGFGATTVDPALYEKYRAAGMSHEQAMAQASIAATAAAEQQSAGETANAWAAGINAVIGGLSSVYQMTVQQKMLTTQQHEAAREREAQLQLAKTQAMYVGGGSIKPAQGSTVMMAVPPGQAKKGLSTLLLIGGVAVAGFVALKVVGGGRRRRR